MNQRVKVDTVFADRVRALLQRELDSGWSCARVASEMQNLGHSGWNESTVSAYSRGYRQTLQLDEGLAILAVFGGHAQWVAQEVDRLVRQFTSAAEKRNSPRREGMNT